MGSQDDYEPHQHPDLATRERHLNALIETLKNAGVSGKEKYHAGYASYNPSSHFAPGKGGGLILG